MTEQFSRISLTDDLDRAASLIEAFLLQPSLADSVTEACLDTEDVDRLPLRLPDPERVANSTILQLNPEVQDDVVARKALHELVEELGFGGEIRDMMLYKLLGEQVEHQPASPEESEAADADASEDDDEPSAKRQMQDSEAWHPNLVAAVILLWQCKNIETLYVGKVGHHRMESLLRDVILDANYDLFAIPCLQKLKHVEVLAERAMFEGGQGPRYVTVEFLDYLQLFHRFPALESFSIDGVQEYQQQRNLFVPRTSNLRSLSITHADLATQTISRLLSIPKALETFQLSVGGMLSTDGGGPRICPGLVGEALSAHKDSIQSIDIDIEVTSCPAPNMEDLGENEDDAETDLYQRELYGEEYLELDKELSAEAPAPEPSHDRSQIGAAIGSLHHYKHLRRLSIGPKALFGSHRTFDAVSEDYNFKLIDILPPSLEFLRFYDYKKGQNEAVDKDIEELLQVKADKFPRLVEIEGLSETYEGIWSNYGYEASEEHHYKRPKKDVAWKKVEAPLNGEA